MLDNPTREQSENEKPEVKFEDRSTPRPWAVAKDRGSQHVDDANGNRICTITHWTPGVDAADAALIVRAVNAHNDLLQAAIVGLGFMQAIVGDVEKIAPTDPKVIEGLKARDKVIAAITKAQGAPHVQA